MKRESFKEYSEAAEKIRLSSTVFCGTQFVLLYKVVLAFAPVDIPKCDHSNQKTTEQYFLVVKFITLLAKPHGGSYAPRIPLLAKVV